ncbi:hypothetical protein HPB49_003937 [Dermacentor silvarum]|uniref:Uncharacterized protein n=1 Tax=Dermacentor silvarum TaxID=543639 RepID=A0ACB8DTU3_DERSI|nr:hypothetical protein HPB49_003937 [Dermacentor silvarum]
MESVDSATLKDIVNFLEPFRGASDKLQQEKLPTLPLALLYYRRLKGHLTVTPGGTSLITKLQKRAALFLENKQQIEGLHYVATFLRPPFRHLRALTEAERRSFHSTVRETMVAMLVVPPQENCDLGETTSAQPAKRRLLDFQEWYDDDEVVVEFDELDTYLQSGGSIRR